MTVAVSTVDPQILETLQQTAPQIPFEEITRLVYNTYVPGRFGKIHTGRWKDNDVELKQPFGEHAAIEKEVRLLHKLRHCPQILRLYGYTIDSTTSIVYLVVQHNEHGTLHSYLLNFHPHLTWSDRYNLAMDIALGLRYLHHKGCRHRHLHSASILIDTNGSAVLSDFGNSKDSEVISSREHTTRMAYLAPERLTKTAARYSMECDIYSLGVVLWEISSGRPPYEDLITPQNIQSGALTSLAQNIVAGRRERPVAGTDPLYEELYTRCWHPNPQERPSVEWIIQTLGVLLKQPSSGVICQLEDLSIRK
ncbi:Nuclear receptor sub 2 group C member 2 [Gamsiella multidivaricata]|nr:Nuclear receptor sub 2 group C member 2 [Gamsiella multidivaricata]